MKILRTTLSLVAICLGAGLGFLTAGRGIPRPASKAEVEHLFGNPEGVDDISGAMAYPYIMTQVEDSRITRIYYVKRAEGLFPQYYPDFREFYARTVKP